MQEEQNVLEEQQQDTNGLRQIRVEKLEELKGKGEDPFALTSFPVSIHNAQLRESYEAREKAVIEAADGDEEKLKAG